MKRTVADQIWFDFHFDINLDLARNTLARQFHEAMGLMAEFDAVEPFARASQRGRPRNTQLPSTSHGSWLAHFHSLAMSANHAATSFCIHLDNLNREMAAHSAFRDREVIGGPRVNGLSLFEALRVVGNWARHHYSWNDASSGWSVEVLRRLGLDNKDLILPCRVIASYGFASYIEFERAYYRAAKGLFFRKSEIKRASRQNMRG